MNSFYNWLPLWITSFYLLLKSDRPISGLHPWKQADSLAQIDISSRLLDYPSIFHDYAGSLIFWDTPIYQALIGSVSKLSSLDPLLLARYVNVLLLIATCFFCIRVFSLVFDSFSTFWFLLFLSSNPFILHYFATPLPDLFAIFLGFFGVYLYWYTPKARFGSLFYTLPIFLLFSLATIIKSPIGFYVFILHLSLLFYSKAINNHVVNFKYNLLYLGTPILFLAFLVEKLRSSFLSTGDSVSSFWERNPLLYFGGISDRFSFEVVTTYFKRFILFGGEFSLYRVLFGLFVVLLLAGAIFYSLYIRRIFFSLLNPSLVYIFVFAGRNLELDYYQLPLFFSFACLLSYIALYYQNCFLNRFLRPFFERYPSFNFFIPIFLSVMFVAMIPYLDRLSFRYHSLDPLLEFRSNNSFIKSVSTYSLDLLEVDKKADLHVFSNLRNSSIGAFTRSKISNYSHNFLIDNCSPLTIKQGPVILHVAFVKSSIPSTCINTIISSSSDYLETPNYIAWINNK